MDILSLVVALALSALAQYKLFDAWMDNPDMVWIFWPLILLVAFVLGASWDHWMIR